VYKRQFVKFGAAAFGVAGSDVLTEFDSDEIYAPLALDIGQCRLSVAATEAQANTDLSSQSHVRVATKYPVTTKRFFDQRGIQAECVKLNGAMELAPKIGLCDVIVDLVSTGNTLKANGLKEIETIEQVESFFVVNRTLFKTRHPAVSELLNALKEAVNG